MARFAKYKLGFNNNFLKDGHTMFPQDIVADLNRKSFLEENKVIREKACKSSILLLEDKLDAADILIEKLYASGGLEPDLDLLAQRWMDT